MTEAEAPDTLRILMIEDNPGDVNLLRLAMNAVNPAVELDWARTAEAALVRLETPGIEFDLALLDLNLPTMTGIEFLKRLKTEAWLRRMPVMMLSSSEAPGDVESSYVHAAAGYIVKPSDFDGFRRLATFLNDCWFGDGSVGLDGGDRKVISF
ncbi:MAG: response regulator [Asticcacaulis sp.]|nr:response regulator [Asticcacaulis sp.]